MFIAFMFRHLSGIAIRISICAAHKLPGMVDVVNVTCEHAGCGKRPSFDVAGGKGRFCGRHKLPCMVNVKKQLDVQDNTEGSEHRDIEADDADE